MIIMIVNVGNIVRNKQGRNRIRIRKEENKSKERR